MRCRPFSFVLMVAVGLVGVSPVATAATPDLSSIASSPVTVYAAKWCSACRALERGLTDRQIAFAVIDVDDNPSAFARARAAAGAGSAIPLTSVVTGGSTVWVVGADADAIERASKAGD